MNCFEYTDRTPLLQTKNMLMRKLLLIALLLSALCGGAQDVDVLHYKFAVNLTDAHDTVRGSATIRFVKHAATETAAFHLAQRTPGGKGMQVHAVGLGSDTSFKLPFKQWNDTLMVQTPHGKQGDTLTVLVLYSGVPNNGLVIQRNRHGDRTFFADNWPDRAHYWIPCNDRPGDKASFEFDVTAPAHYEVVSNGVKQSEAVLPNGNRRTLWREDIPQATKVMVIGVARFAVTTFPDSPPGIPVSAWVYPQDSTDGFYDYALAPGILKFFSNYIAPFPYRKLANVQSKTVFGGMENASCIFYAESSVTGRRESEALMVHEIAHQWFGDAASEKSFAHLWLSEGFATYLTHVYLNAKYGKESFRERLQADREEVIAFARSSSRPVVDSVSRVMSLLNANSYQKGGWVLHMLRGEVGDGPFQRILQTYYSRHKGGNADTRDFEAIAEQVSGKELTPFFDQWLYQPGVPKLKVEQITEDTVTRIKVVQTGETVYRFPLTVSISANGNPPVVERIRLNGREATLAWKGENLTDLKVVLDPDTELLFGEEK